MDAPVLNDLGREYGRPSLREGLAGSAVELVIMILVVILLLAGRLGKGSYGYSGGSRGYFEGLGGAKSDLHAAPNVSMPRVSATPLKACTDPECPKLRTKILNEIARLEIIMRFTKKMTAFAVGVKEYETKNIMERLIITMGNYAGAEDAIFYKCTKADYPVKKAMEEFVEKSRLDMDQAELNHLFDGFLADVHGFLASKSTGAQNVSGIYKMTVGEGLFKVYNEAPLQNEAQKPTGPPIMIYKMSVERHKKMRERAIFAGACVDHIDHYIVCMLLRYECMLPSGQQWGFSNEMYRNLAENYNVRVECFGSPKNSQFVLLGNICEFTPASAPKFRAYDKYFCSLFHDTDHYFGSLGSFFDFDIQGFMTKFGLNKCGFMVGPPYIDDIMTRCVKKFIGALETCPQDKQMRFVYNMPAWADSESYKGAKNSKFLVYDKFLPAKKHYYINTNDVRWDKKAQRDLPAIIVAKFPSHIFLLEHPKWPGTNYRALTSDYEY